MINRLGEVLVVRLLRRQLEAGSLRVGLLGGLADKRLSRAIVAMHERPERVWSVDDLAEIAGLSVSRFAQLFKVAVGQSPLSYLRKWRLVLAKQDIERGDRVSSTALRYAYGSSEAMSRAFYQQYRIKPVALRKQMAEGLARP
ncbi:helix-turn-helix transcriptional regulator [Devosia sp. J2-20]|uniref:helix-turn-helix domain-containing protein n=1 Tax=Devosia sp. J2-20 TaxID=3026161 RepID=UPI00249C8EE3|nr:helix-turn-helix transcriptional regulator [Devosia sp. J2-20]WDQ99309.1 helix-turn-helix transcriptional regulator [Devosia sp. J2-20]